MMLPFRAATMTIGCLSSFLCVLGCVVRAAAGQSPPPSATAQPEGLHVGSVALSGAVRARLERWNWFAWPDADSDYQYGLTGLRLNAAQQRRRVDWQAELSFPLLLNLPPAAIAPEPAGVLGYGAGYFGANQRRNATAAVLRQGFLRIKHLGSERNSLRFGRFEAADGAEARPSDPDVAWLKTERINQRLVASYSYVQRAFDGAQFTRVTAKDNVTVTGARVVDGSFHLRANREIGVGLLYAAFTRALTGSAFHGEVRAFGLQFVDARGLAKADNRPAEARDADRDTLRISTAGAHFVGLRRTDRGAVDWVLWSAAQLGTWGRLDHRAGAMAAEGGYQLASAWRPWLRAGYYWSSGDGDPVDGTHNTFFQLLANPRTYARLPYYGYMNTRDLFGQVLLRPHARVLVRGEVHDVRLTTSQDLWYDGGGAFEDHFGYVGRPSGGHTGIGVGVDASGDWAVTPTTSLTVAAGMMRGGGVANSVFGPDAHARVALLEMARRF